MASGLSANPNFFGSYMAMLLGLTTCLYLKSRKPIYQFLSILFMIGLTLANSTGPFLGFFIGFVYCSLIFIKKIKFRTSFLTLALMVVVFNITANGVESFFAQKNVSIAGNYEIKSDIKVENIKNENYSSSNGRLHLWANSLPVLKKYWLIGSGPDTFMQVYPQNPGLTFDKAHNVYLQMGITTGIFSVIVYLGMLFIITIKGFKLKIGRASCRERVSSPA